MRVVVVGVRFGRIRRGWAAVGRWDMWLPCCRDSRGREVGKDVMRIVGLSRAIEDIGRDKGRGRDIEDKVEEEVGGEAVVTRGDIDCALCGSVVCMPPLLASGGFNQVECVATIFGKSSSRSSKSYGLGS